MTLLEWTIDGILDLGCFEPSPAYFRQRFTTTLLFATQVRRPSILVADISVYHHMIVMDRSIVSLTSMFTVVLLPGGSRTTFMPCLLDSNISPRRL